MQALTLWQPWATLIVLGLKRYETRSWGTYYRGPLLIHAGKRCDRQHERMLREEGWLDDVDGPLPTGVILAVAQLASMRAAAGVDVDHKEMLFGDFSLGRYAWRLADVRPLAEPIPCRGKQGLWTPDAHVLDLVDAQLARL